MPERPEHFDCMKNNARHADVRGPDGDTGACASLWEISRSLAFRGNSLVLRLGVPIRSSIPRRRSYLESISSSWRACSRQARLRSGCSTPRGLIFGLASARRAALPPVAGAASIQTQPNRNIITSPKYGVQKIDVLVPVYSSGIELDPGTPRSSLLRSQGELTIPECVERTLHPQDLSSLPTTVPAIV